MTFDMALRRPLGPSFWISGNIYERRSALDYPNPWFDIVFPAIFLKRGHVLVHPVDLVQRGT
jgi:hypothetical protein